MAGRLKGLIDAGRKALDMSREARMARAREMGFDTERVWYHGTRAPENFDSLQPGLGERGMSRLQSGRNIHTDGVFVASNPDRAAEFAGVIEADGPIVPGSRVLPVRLAVNNPRTLSADELKDYTADELLAEGFDGVRVAETGELIALRPQDVRSEFAAFDPAQRNSSNLLAGVGGAAVGAGLLGAPQESEAAPMGTLARQLGKRTREAWHGSPHVYDQVDLSHMGSGEGAQAYGAGYYAADAREVAEQYRDDLGRLYGRGSQLDGEDIPTWIVDEVEAGRADKVRADFTKRRADALERAAREGNLQPHMDRMRADTADRVLRQIDALEAGARAQPNSALYRLEIPDEDLLDWDAPLSEQPWFRPVDEVVREYREAGRKPDAYARLIAKANASPNQTGRQFYEDQLAAFGGDQLNVSGFLNDAGIPGIRYLDGMSRNAGEGSRNYVIFDDRNVNVVERNGRPVDAPPRGRAGGVVGPARAAAAALAAGTAGAGFLAPQSAEAAALDEQIQALAPSVGEVEALRRMQDEARVLNRYREEQLRLDPFARDPGVMANLEARIMDLRNDPLVVSIRERQEAAAELRGEYRMVTGQDYGAPPVSPDQRVANIAADASERFQARRETPRATAIENYAYLMRTLPMTPWAGWDAAASFASGMAGDMLGGLTMLGVAPLKGLDAAVDAGDSVRESFAREPQTERGAEVLEAIGGVMGAGVEAALDTEPGRFVRPFPDYLDDRVVPALQDALGDEAGAIAGAAIRSVPEVL